MLKLIFEKRFAKDLKLIIKRNFDLNELNLIIDKLQKNVPLSPKIKIIN